MKRRNIVALSIFFAFYILFGAAITLNQEKMVYVPYPQDFASCTTFADAEKISYNGTRMYTSISSSTPTVVLYHGNAGSACDRALYVHLINQAGLGYIFVEYAGYSNDTDTPTHKTLQQDVQNTVAYIQNESITPVYVIGESIGTGAAAHHAALLPPERLLLISPFTDLYDVAKQRFWFYPTRLLVDNAFDNTHALSQYNGETLIVHGTDDTIIPYALGTQLYQTLPGSKTLLTVEDAGHNNLFSFEEVHTSILEFLSQ